MLVFLSKKIGFIFSLKDRQWGRGSNESSEPHAQEGKKPSDGPPDLDQLWRDFNLRLSRLLGQKSGGGDSGGFKPDLKGAGIGGGVIAVVALFLWLSSGFFIVQEGQQAVVLTFGKFNAHELPRAAGFQWRWPYPIQTHELVNVSQVRTVEVGYKTTVSNKQPKEALMLTGDENIIDIQFAVQYQTKNAVEWLFNNRDPETMVHQVAETSIREIVGKNKMDFVLYEGRDNIALEAKKLMQEIFEQYHSGVQIMNVTMQGVQPPEQVQTAFDDAVKANQDQVRKTNEGQAYANEVIPKARGDAFVLMQEAEAYRARIVANAEGDVSRFKQVLTQYQKAPGVTRDRMYLETMQQIFANTTKIMMDAKGGNNLLYLPLDKLMAQSVANDAAGKLAASPTTAVTVNPPPDPLQSLEPHQRDGRNRDREAR